MSIFVKTFMRFDRRLLGVRKPGGIIAQTKPGSSRNLFYLLSRAPHTDAVVFAHDVNRTAVLPFQTHIVPTHD
jgi:hypothetical protein